MVLVLITKVIPSAVVNPPGLLNRNWNCVLKVFPVPSVTAVVLYAAPLWFAADGVRRRTVPSPVTAVVVLPAIVRPVVLENPLKLKRTPARD